MIIKEILAKLEIAVNPVAHALHVGEHFKTLVIGFKKGMILKEHRAHLPSKLFVLQGKVTYKQNEVSSTLELFDNIDIPVNIIHSVEALEDSLCILTQG